MRKLICLVKTVDLSLDEQQAVVEVELYPWAISMTEATTTLTRADS